MQSTFEAMIDARVLGVFGVLGTVEAGKLADLVVMRGDLTAEPSVIRNVMIVFKDGVGYESASMQADVQGWIGINGPAQAYSRSPRSPTQQADRSASLGDAPATLELRRPPASGPPLHLDP